MRPARTIIAARRIRERAGLAHPLLALTSALAAGLIRTMEDVLTVLRQGSQPLGPMGAEWLERQGQVLKRDDP